MMRYGFLLFLILLSGTSSAYYEFDNNLHQSYSALMDLQFDKAGELLNKESTEKPGNDLVLLFRNYIDFLKAFISEEEASAEVLKKNSSARLKQLTKKEENAGSPFHLYAQAEMYIQQAFVKVKLREYVSAASDVRRAYRLIDNNSLQYSSFPLNQKLYGLLHIIIGSVPREYHWLVELAGMDGTVSQGTEELNQLYKTVNNTPYDCYKEEILFYLSNVYSIYHADDELKLMETLMMVQPYSTGSPLMRYCVSSILMKLGKNDDAIRVLEEPESYMTSYPFNFLYYKLGLAKLRKLDYSAKSDFEKYVSSFKGQNYVKSAWQKIAWINRLTGDMQGYYAALAHCKTDGVSFIDEDKDALNEANAAEPVNTLLLRSRLLFDGGYYERAQTELSGMPIDSFPRYRDQLEVTYRLARIAQKTGNMERAIDFYQKTIKNGSSSRAYFAANSSLLLGLYYEESHDYIKAKECFSNCLSMGIHEYQNSIDQKAQAGLDRVKEAEDAEAEKQ